MSALTLTLREPIRLPVDASPLTPERLAAYPERELAAVPLQVGNRKVPLGELFTIATGEPETLVLRGTGAAWRRLGQGMSQGRLVVEGDAGDRLGESMKGGTIEVAGSAGAFAGTLMHAGTIRVAGDAGAFAGAALAGGRFGMTGGALIVGGSLGERAGDRMQRGVIVAGGEVGAFAGARMIGGTIVALGACGPDPGYVMRRGTLLLARDPVSLLSTFLDNGTHDLPWLTLLGRHLAGLGVAAALPGPRVRRLTGCASAGGAGEILIAA